MEAMEKTCFFGWHRSALPTFSGMAWYNKYSGFAPYVPVGERRRKAAATAQKMNKSGKTLLPVVIEGRKIAATFWGHEWCENLESYSDYANRIPRGRTYVRNGSVIDLQISQGKVTALVMGSSLYKVEVTVTQLGTTAWSDFKKRCAGKITSLLDLLQGRLDKGVLQEITRRPGGLFPSPREIEFACSCPDDASMCKHVAAALYGVGARLDGKPELFFTLRGTDMQELISAAASTAASAGVGPAGGGLDAGELSDIFGVEIESTPVKLSAVASRKSSAKTPLKATKKAVAKVLSKSSKTPLKTLPKTPVKASKEPLRAPPVKSPTKSLRTIIARSQENAAKRAAKKLTAPAPPAKPTATRASAKKSAKKISKK